MANEHNAPDGETTLHLGKFAPGQQPNPDETSTGVTMMIQRAAAQTMEQGARPVAPREAGELPPDKMLGAVSYCYAKGVYTSEEIEQKMLKDKELREAVHGNVPDARAIRRFRQLNRGAIQATLEKAFGFLRRRQKHEAKAAPEGRISSSPSPDLVGDSTILVARQQAQQRLNDAAFIDNMSKD